MTRILLDTNVIVRLSDPAAPEHGVVRAALGKLIERETVLCITAQVLIEFWAVATRPPEANGLGWTVEQTRHALDGLLGQLTLLNDSPDVLTVWLDLASTGVSGKRAHDARIVAVAVAHGVEAVLTLNTKDFAGFEGVQAVHPRDVT
jgi:predicted nucleic acid-binding protein